MLRSKLPSEIILNRIRRRRRREARERRQRYFAYFRRRQRETTNFMILLLAMCDSKECIPRAIWALPKSMHWWNNIVLATWDDQIWLENFRMTKATFNYLLEELKPHISKRDTHFRKAIPPDQRLAITLWRLATNIEYGTLGELFGVGKSSVCCIFRSTVTAINDVLEKSHISIPTGQRLQECIQKFEDKGFPQAAAAIDCCHIPIKTPPHKSQEYFNSRFSSIILQAAVDSFGQFIAVDIGSPGSMYDAGVFNNSELSRKLKDESLFPNSPRVIEATPVPVLVLGDEEYPLMPNLMKPYTDNGTLTAAQKGFNHSVRSCHSTVKNAFGHLRGRWNILAKTLDQELEKIPSVVLACCILHNIVESHGDPFLDEWIQRSVIPVPRGPAYDDDASSVANATSIRNALTAYFVDQGTRKIITLSVASQGVLVDRELPRQEREMSMRLGQLL